jgi:hypothetical protein
VSGNDEETVDLFGPAMNALVQAIPQLEGLLGRPIVLVGGLAVLARLGTTYRVTSDVDIVNRRDSGDPAQLDILLAHGVTATDAAGAIIATPLGDVRVDILEISADQLGELPADPTDRLYLLALDWALRTATTVRIRVVNDESRTVEASVFVAESGPLIATKLQALPNRSAAKESTDLLDIIRLVLDQQAGPVARKQLAAAGEQLKKDAALHVRRWFVERAERSLRLVRSTPAGHEVDFDTVALSGELLIASLGPA